jgi:hypothetical protein
MANNGKQIGVAGNAPYRGIPVGAILEFKGYKDGLAHQLKIFNSIDKGHDADVAQTNGNKGEFLASRRRNMRREVRIEGKPVGATAAAALDIAANPPMRNDLVEIKSATEDADLNSTNYIINSRVDVRYTPEGEAVMSMDLLCYLDDAGAPIALTVLADA